MALIFLQSNVIILTLNELISNSKFKFFSIFLVLLCTLANVKEFKTNNFLETIYSFQNRFGCFGEEDDNNRKNMISLLKRKHDINRKEIDTLSSLLENERERRRRRRVRREDKLMNNGCSSHATGLALGYYSTLIAVNLEKIDNN